MLIMKINQFFRKVNPASVFSFKFSTNTANGSPIGNQRQQSTPDAQNRYSLKILTEEHQEDSIKLLEEVFINDDPARHSFYLKNPEKVNQEKLFWQALKKIYAKEIFSKGLSIGCFDLENQGELVAASFSKDINYSPSIVFEHYESSLRPAYDLIQKKLYHQIFPSYSRIFTKKKSTIIDHWFAGVKEGHKDKRLFAKMIAASDYVAAGRGFAYSFLWATNFKAGKTMKRLNYEKISEIDVKDFIYKGQQYFEDVGELDRYQSFWIRKLDKTVEEELLQKIDV